MPGLVPGIHAYALKAWCMESAKRIVKHGCTVGKPDLRATSPAMTWIGLRRYQSRAYFVTASPAFFSTSFGVA